MSRRAIHCQPAARVLRSLRGLCGLAALVLVFAGLGCGGRSEDTTNDGGSAKTEAPAQRTEGTQHADTGVVPGSYEDWCGEHQVAESMCTRCDPTLVAAFKATGDWCSEHGLPESQCLQCNPGLEIKRPPKPEEK